MDDTTPMRVSNRIAHPIRKLQLLTGARISIDANELASNYFIGVVEPSSIALLLSGMAALSGVRSRTGRYA